MNTKSGLDPRQAFSGCAAMFATIAGGAIGATLLHTSPASAAFMVPLRGSFDSTNTPPTGVAANFTFSNFATSGTNNELVSFDFSFENLDGPIATTTSSRLGGVGFDLLPGLTFLSGGNSGSNVLSSYNPNGTAYEDVFAPATIGGLSTYDIGLQAVDPVDGVAQFISNPNQFNGTGPGVSTALKQGKSATVKFTFNSSLNLDAAAFELAYLTFFTNGAPDTAGARFQSIVGGAGGGTSDKIGSGPPSGFAPGGDAVPGPVPLFGAAAAFSYSRKLRNRLKSNVVNLDCSTT
jgi:hypothetical protein